MSNSRKTVWIIFGLFMFVQLVIAYMVDKNQQNLDFLLNMKRYIPFMLYFSLAGFVLFLLAFMFNQVDFQKSKKLITQLENDKNQLKAKLFDMQEEQNKEERKKVEPVSPQPKLEEPKPEESEPEQEDYTD